MAGASPYLGRKVSVTSRLEIRYEGILYSVDSKQHTIALSKVRSYGTESRECTRRIYGRDDIYDYVIFRASDIKDFQIENCDENLAPNCVDNDPAVLLHSDPVPPLVSALMGYPKINGNQIDLSPVLMPKSAESSFNLSTDEFKADSIFQNSEQSVYSVFNEPDYQQAGVSHEPDIEVGVQATENSNLFKVEVVPNLLSRTKRSDSTSSSQSQKPKVTFQCDLTEPTDLLAEPTDLDINEELHLATSSTPLKKTPKSKGDFKPIQQGGGSTNGFDFEESNSKFIAFDQYEMEYDKVTTGAAKFYDKAKSFFDRISNNQTNPVDWKKEKKNDVETFGQMVSLNKDIYTRQSRGTNYQTRSRRFNQESSEYGFGNGGLDEETPNFVRVEGWY